MFKYFTYIAPRSMTTALKERRDVAFLEWQQKTDSGTTLLNGQRQEVNNALQLVSFSQDDMLSLFLRPLHIQWFLPSLPRLFWYPASSGGQATFKK